jgi:hypothetical protein
MATVHWIWLAQHRGWCWWVLMTMIMKFWEWIDCLLSRIPYHLSLIFKIKLSRYGHAGAKMGRRYSSYSFLTWILDGVSGQRHAPASLYPRELTPGTNCTGGWVGLRARLDTEARETILCFSRDRTPVVKSVVRHYTDWASPAPCVCRLI